MADEDKLLGVAYSGRTKNYTYSAYRVDYDSAESIVTLSTEDIVEDGEVVGQNEPEFSGATKNPPAGYPGHEAKSGYQRKILVEDETTRDEVKAILKEADIDYEIEGITTSDEEKSFIKDYGAESSLEVPFALQWMDSLKALDNGTISVAQFERWNNSKTEDRQVPTLSVEDGLLTNDGTETETVTISHPYSVQKEAVLTVGDTSFTITLTPGEDYMETVTTTRPVGASIEVGLLGDFIGPGSVEIEVTE